LSAVACYRCSRASEPCSERRKTRSPAKGIFLLRRPQAVHRLRQGAVAPAAAKQASPARSSVTQVKQREQAPALHSRRPWLCCHSDQRSDPVCRSLFFL